MGRRWRAGCAVALFYLIVWGAAHGIPSHNPLDLTFNSMLDRLIQGRFDVDPAIVGREGFLRDGRVYAYWGPLPALLRLPVAVLPGWRHLDFTIPYCAVALVAMASVKLWTLRFVSRHAPESSRPLHRAMAVTITLSGAQICFLRFNVYQEVCLWAGLFGAIFVAAAIVAQHRGLGRRERLVMALAAGAALLTRVSVGIGLVAAFVLLLAVETIAHRTCWRVEVRKSALPLLTLAAAGLVTGWINIGRWGNPLTFADYHRYIYNIQFPDRIARTAMFGLFNIRRIPFGLLYYFAPAWVLHGGDGHLLFDATRSRLIDSAELPPSSFLLTDPLLLLLGFREVVGWARQGVSRNRDRHAIATGLALPPLLMLTAISMCFRYRIDFYPLIDFLAFSALGRGAPAISPAALRGMWLLVVISVAGSLAVSTAYLVGGLGPGELLIGQGVERYYLGRLGLSH